MAGRQPAGKERRSDSAPVDDQTLGMVLRALRRRRGWRQADLAREATCSQALVSNVERGHVDHLAVGRLRSLFSAVESRILLEPRWRGAELDRLLDSVHAGIVTRVVERLERAGWTTAVEVTYSEFGERGSIDVLGLRPTERAALIVEVKSDIASSEGVGRKLDEKGRLAPAIVRQRFGWTPAAIGVVLVMPESPRLRRLVEGPAAALHRTYPIDARAVRTWLEGPVGQLAATSFLSGISDRNVRRVRRADRSRIRPSAPTEQLGSSVNRIDEEGVPTILR